MLQFRYPSTVKPVRVALVEPVAYQGAVNGQCRVTQAGTGERRYRASTRETSIGYRGGQHRIGPSNSDLGTIPRGFTSAWHSRGRTSSDAVRGLSRLGACGA